MSGPAAVLGAGSWGTALALLLADGGDNDVRLYDHDVARAEILRTTRENARYLPGHTLPPALHPTASLSEALTGAGLVVVAMPCAALGSILAAVSARIAPGTVVVLATKGLDPQTLQTPAERAAPLLPHCPLVALSGPNLAREVARNVPTASVAASDSPEAAQAVAERFNRPTFRTYVSDDPMGVEVGGAVKNVLAIAGGVSDGLGYGDNTKAALLTRGLAEMARLGVALGGRQETFYGLAGVGDLFATAASRLSRNSRVGNGLARGLSLPAVLEEIGQVAEGVPTAEAVVQLAKRHGLSLPVCEVVHALLQCRLSPQDAVARLTDNRPARREKE